ncbi:MAG TPA: hypothetical protein VK983_03780 [Candidatus Limnocylindrales bacterium]|nr:hypothetical protein [Candidatus Limnocylindrales bacterium]
MNKAALKAVSRLTRIDLVSAARTKRHNPILDSEIHIEEELINLQESLDSLYAAGDTLQQYPKIKSHISQEKRQITKHCIGMIIRMMHGRALPRSYTQKDIEFALAKLVQLVVDEARRTGKRIDEDMIQVFRPFLSLRQRVEMRELGFDMVVQASQMPRLMQYVNRLSVPKLRA